MLNCLIHLIKRMDQNLDVDAFSGNKYLKLVEHSNLILINIYI